ncbi:leucine-rich repeat domain-containing protein [Wolbachia endosymbiont (group A) of Clivina fossor]|uniref:leucine-rich repeat domain-containing protein n=1 Tax=Wolbachia endosymbiont (group A) of Clivina fossor TaxID=3066133 RepID=UPI0031331808
MTFDKHVYGNSLRITGAINISELVSFLQNRTNITKLSLLEVRDESLKGLAFRERFTSGCLEKSISVKGIKELAKLKNLTSLDLSGDDVTDEGVKELAKLKNLTSLNLDRNYITDEGVKELAKLKNLTSLDLSGVRIGVKGIKELAKLKNLTSLSLLRCYGQKDDECVKELAKLKNLISLDLNDNRIGGKGAKALANGNLRNLTSLCLSHNLICGEGVEALANGNLKNLTSLNLKYNCFGDKGAEALANGNLKNLTSLYLRYNGIFNQGAKELAKLKNLTSLYLSHYSHRTLEAQKALAESRKKVILDRATDYYHFVQDAWSKNSNASRLDENITKELFFKLAMRDGKDWVVLLLNDLDKYPFLINSRDEEGHTLSHFYTHSPRMQELLFEHGLIPEQERNQRRDDERIARDSQSVHKSLVVKRTNFFAKKLVESTKASEGQLEQTVNSYVESIGLLKQYQNDPIRLRLLSLTDNEKKSAMEETLRETDPTPGDEKFIEAVVDKAEQALKQQYLKKNFRGEYDQGYPTNRMQYDYTRGSERFITIPESIGYIKLLIDDFSVPLKEKKELLVTLMEQNPDLVKNKLSKVKEKLGNSVILDKEQFNKTELHGLLDGIDDGKKVDELFKEISCLNIEEVWREQKEFILLKQIYIAATTYGENSGACVQGTWSQIISSINEISSEIVAQYDRYLEEEQKQEMRKNAITKENVIPFVEDLAGKLIQYVKDNPELKEVLQHHLLYLEHIDVDDPEKVTFEQQKILAEINKYFSENIKGVLRNYNRNIPSRGEYSLVIEELSKVKAMQNFAQEPSNQQKNITTDEESKDAKNNNIQPSNPDDDAPRSKKRTIVTASALAIAGVVSGIAIAVHLEMLAVGIAVGACCLLAAAIIYYCNRPSHSLENSSAEKVVNPICLS